MSLSRRAVTSPVGDWQGVSLRVSEKFRNGQYAAVILQAPDGRIAGGEAENEKQQTSLLTAKIAAKLPFGAQLAVDMRRKAHVLQ